MKRIDVLLLNFSIENMMEPWVDRGIIYTIYTGKNIDIVKKYYSKQDFELIFMKADGSDYSSSVIKYLRSTFSEARIITVSERPEFSAAYRYTKDGAYDFRKSFNDFFDFKVLLEKYGKNTDGCKYTNKMNQWLSGRKYRNRRLHLSLALTNTITACLLRVKRKNRTMNHLSGVAQYSRMLAEEYARLIPDKNSFSREEIEYIYLGGRLHDIGKVEISEDIVDSPGALSDNDFKIMQNHTYYGHDILSYVEDSNAGEPAEFFKTAKDMALYHHENYDGTGYPEGLKGDNIPRSARICAVADTYGALLSNRFYREALSHREACDIILNQDRNRFDPDVLEIFSLVEDVFEEISILYQENIKKEYFPHQKLQCAWCYSIQVYGKWLPNDRKISATHGVCPSCFTKISEEEIVVNDGGSSINEVA